MGRGRPRLTEEEKHERYLAVLERAKEERRAWGLKRPGRPKKPKQETLGKPKRAYRVTEEQKKRNRAEYRKKTYKSKGRGLVANLFHEEEDRNKFYKGRTHTVTGLTNSGVKVILHGGLGRYW